MNLNTIKRASFTKLGLASVVLVAGISCSVQVVDSSGDVMYRKISSSEY